MNLTKDYVKESDKLHKVVYFEQNKKFYKKKRYFDFDFIGKNNLALNTYNTILPLIVSGKSHQSSISSSIIEVNMWDTLGG